MIENLITVLEQENMSGLRVILLFWFITVAFHMFKYVIANFRKIIHLEIDPGEFLVQHMILYGVFIGIALLYLFGIALVNSSIDIIGFLLLTALAAVIGISTAILLFKMR